MAGGNEAETAAREAGIHHLCGQTPLKIINLAPFHHWGRPPTYVFKPASFPIEKIESIIRLRAMSSHTRELNCTKEMKYKRKKSKVERKQVAGRDQHWLITGFFSLHSAYFVAISV